MRFLLIFLALLTAIPLFADYFLIDDNKAIIGDILSNNGECLFVKTLFNIVEIPFTNIESINNNYVTVRDEALYYVNHTIFRNWPSGSRPSSIKNNDQILDISDTNQLTPHKKMVQYHTNYEEVNLGVFQVYGLSLGCFKDYIIQSFYRSSISTYGSIVSELAVNHHFSIGINFGFTTVFPGAFF